MMARTFARPPSAQAPQAPQAARPTTRPTPAAPPLELTAEPVSTHSVRLRFTDGWSVDVLPVGLSSNLGVVEARDQLLARLQALSLVIALARGGGR